MDYRIPSVGPATAPRHRPNLGRGRHLRGTRLHCDAADPRNSNRSLGTTASGGSTENRRADGDRGGGDRIRPLARHFASRFETEQYFGRRVGARDRDRLWTCQAHVRWGGRPANSHRCDVGLARLLGTRATGVVLGDRTPHGGRVWIRRHAVLFAGGGAADPTKIDADRRGRPGQSNAAADSPRQSNGLARSRVDLLEMLGKSSR